MRYICFASVSLILMAVTMTEASGQVPAPLTSDIVACREARLAARQAIDLAPTLHDLGLTSTQAVDYLDKFRKEVDACESQQGHAVPGIPPFPARTTISPSDLTLPRTIPPHQPTLAVAGLDYRNILGPTIFLNELAAYREALLKQCNATPDLARIASTQALFEKNLDRAAFGHCRANAARGPNSGNNPTLPSFSSAEAQCHIAAIDHLKSPYS